MSDTYYNPPTPFKINVSLMKQKKFIIKGRPLAGCKRFNLNFQKGRLEDAENVAFHFDVRFDYGGSKKTLITNYRKRGQWGPQRTISNFPFSEKEEFEIAVLVYDDMYQVDVNGQEIALFQHQIPIQDVDTFTIEEDVTLSMVKVT